MGYLVVWLQDGTVLGVVDAEQAREFYQLSVDCDSKVDSDSGY